MFNRPSKKVYESVFNLSDPRVKQAQEIANRCRKPFFLIRNALGGIDFVGVEVATLDEHGETRVPLAIVHPEELPEGVFGRDVNVHVTPKYTEEAGKRMQEYCQSFGEFAPRFPALFRFNHLFNAALDQPFDTEEPVHVTEDGELKGA